MIQKAVIDFNRNRAFSNISVNENVRFLVKLLKIDSVIIYPQKNKNRLRETKLRIHEW